MDVPVRFLTWTSLMFCRTVWFAKTPARAGVIELPRRESQTRVTSSRS
jgi:hypothetical protein